MKTGEACLQRCESESSEQEKQEAGYVYQLESHMSMKFHRSHATCLPVHDKIELAVLSDFNMLKAIFVLRY